MYMCMYVIIHVHVHIENILIYYFITTSCATAYTLHRYIVNL